MFLFFFKRLNCHVLPPSPPPVTQHALVRARSLKNHLIPALLFHEVTELTNGSAALPHARYPLLKLVVTTEGKYVYF